MEQGTIGSYFKSTIGQDSYHGLACPIPNDGYSITILGLHNIDTLPNAKVLD